MPLNSPSDAIAKLMNDIGIAVSMDYRPNQSGSTPSKASKALHSYFRYQTVEGASKIQYSDPNWINKLKAELDAGRPILYSGFNENYTSAHTFICDGYDLSDYFHFNWGWNGSYDGWFTLNDLTPDNHNYTTSQDALFNIVPISEVYVDDDYIPYGYNDGHWFGVEAFDNIQDAILFVYPEGTVYVAAGTYYEAINFGGKAIHLYGIEGPEVTTINGNGAYHVVRCISGETANTILEGFTITGGDANSSNFPDNCAGGMYNNGSSPTVINCIFSGNSADYGGGMYNRNSGPTVIKCTFSGNSADYGGGMWNESDSSPTVTNCTFSINKSAARGGGMSNETGSNPTVSNCTFTGNESGSGGGMYNGGTNPMVTNCMFGGNSADYGGGMWNYDASPMVTNCTFSSNTSTNRGSGMYNEYYSHPTVTNCTFTSNTGTYDGGGMWNRLLSDPTATNCIFWGNGSGGGQIYNVEDSTPVVTYSDVQGGTGQSWFGTGCIDTDPCFVDAYNPDPNLLNLRLKLDSPCIDAADNSSVPADTADLDKDGNSVEPIPFDLGGFPRFSDGDCNDTNVVDMGAYEFLSADIDSSGTVDMCDFSMFALHWAETACGRCDGTDMNCDGSVDLHDLRELTDWWLVGE